MMTTERSTKIVNFMTPGAGVLVLGGGHISHIVKMHYFFNKRPTGLNGHLSVNCTCLISKSMQIIMTIKNIYGL